MDTVTDGVLRGATTIARVRSRRTPTGLVKLNLGSGPAQVAPGWIGVDASAHLLVRWLPAPLLRRMLRHTDIGEEATTPLKRGRFILWDLSHGIPFADATVDWVFSSHMLEHLTDPAAEALLRDCHRVLAAAGALRLAVPEVEADAPRDEYERAGRYLHTHLSRWTWPKLRATLERSGFASVERVAYRVGHCPDLDLLDTRPGSLFVEAVKAAGPSAADTPSSTSQPFPGIG